MILNYRWKNKGSIIVELFLNKNKLGNLALPVLRLILDPPQVNTNSPAVYLAPPLPCSTLSVLAHIP
jgi:hypothetical protein